MEFFLSNVGTFLIVLFFSFLIFINVYYIAPSNKYYKVIRIPITLLLLILCLCSINLFFN